MPTIGDVLAYILTVVTTPPVFLWEHLVRPLYAILSDVPRPVVVTAATMAALGVVALGALFSRDQASGPGQSS